jgi:hypothetical protein
MSCWNLFNQRSPGFRYDICGRVQWYKQFDREKYSKESGFVDFSPIRGLKIRSCCQYLSCGAIVCR